jgi:hypothetical protein
VHGKQQQQQQQQQMLGSAPRQSMMAHDGGWSLQLQPLPAVLASL